MKLYTYIENGLEKIGVGNDNNIIHPIDGYKSMNDFITDENTAKWDSVRNSISSKNSVSKDAVRILAPIPFPMQDILCLGVNYMAHAKEAEEFHGTFERAPDYAIYFAKRTNRTTSPGEDIPMHADVTDSLDYEAELAVIIGKDAKNVSEENAYDYVFGYTVFNDVSARNVQTEHKQWYFGKSLDGFSPMGPCIVTADEIGENPKLNIKSYVNGELRQNSNTSLMIFKIHHVIAELSKAMTLKSGTIIATGTPAGVGMGFNPPKFLKDGDEVKCVIDGIGELCNTVRK